MSRAELRSQDRPGSFALLAKNFCHSGIDPVAGIADDPVIARMPPPAASLLQKIDLTAKPGCGPCRAAVLQQTLPPIISAV
jgi:hypothetical protein